MPSTAARILHIIGVDEYLKLSLSQACYCEWFFRARRTITTKNDELTVNGAGALAFENNHEKRKETSSFR